MLQYLTFKDLSEILSIGELMLIMRKTAAKTTPKKACEPADKDEWNQDYVAVSIKSSLILKTRLDWAEIPSSSDLCCLI